MSTPQEQREAIEASIKAAKKRLERFKLLSECSRLDKRDLYEMEMMQELVVRGEKLLGDRK